MYALLFDGTLGETLTISSTLMIIGSTLILGFFICLVYWFTHRKEGYSAGFLATLIMLPVIIAMIILLVGNNVARAFSLAGAFSLIRFRSTPGDVKDISYVFFTLGVGLACGMGYIGYGAIFTAILCMVMILLSAVHFNTGNSMPMQLKILLPEDMDYNGIFDEDLQRYTESSRLVKVKTSDFGSLFELTYDIILRDIGGSKELMDRIRCKNGNLNIILSAGSMKE